MLVSMCIVLVVYVLCLRELSAFQSGLRTRLAADGESVEPGTYEVHGVSANILIGYHTFSVCGCGTVHTSASAAYVFMCMFRKGVWVRCSPV